jgi:predicted metal-binding protein
MSRGWILAVSVAAVGTATMYFINRLCKRHITNKVKNTLFICTTCSTSKREGIVLKEGESKLLTGPSLFQNVVSKFLQAENVNVLPESVDINETFEFQRENGAILRVQPQKCLSACSKANCIALSHPNKYQYHFAMLEENGIDDIEDIVKFAKSYADRTDEVFTKKGDRPDRLKSTVISRLPPPNPLSCQ